MNDTLQGPAPLPSPRIPDAFDGGLGYEDLQRNPNVSIVVQVPPWDGYEDGDVLEILWGAAETVVGSRLANAIDVNKGLEVFVPATAIVNQRAGIHDVRAQVRGLLGNTVKSPPITVVVKLTVPGGLDPDPTTPYQNENLDPPTVEPTDIGTDKKAKVTVPPYENMAAGDIVTVQWNADGNDVTYGPLTEAEVGRPVVFDIDSDMIDIGGIGERLIVTYQVYDEVRNWSLWSPFALVNVPDPNAPPAPAVEPTVGNQGTTIDVDTLGTNDVRVYVEASGVLTGESVVVQWAGTTATGGPVTFNTPPQTATRDNQTLVFTIPNAFVVPLAQGTARAGYAITALNGTTRQSARRNLQLVGQAVRLLPPAVDEATGNTLDPANVPTSGAHATVPPWAGMRSGDVLELILDGQTSNGSPTRWSESLPISSGMVGSPVRFTIPRAQIEALVNGTLSLYYTVQPFALARKVGTREFREIRFAPLRSDALQLDVRTANPQPLLQAPSIREAVNGVLDPDLYPSPHIDIPAYTGIAVNDRIDVTLRGGVVPYDDSIPVANPALPPSFLVPAQVITANRNQTLVAAYVVTRAAGGRADSLGETFRIGSAAQDLPMPTVDEATGANLDPFLAGSGITVRIPATVSITPDQQVAVTVTGPGGNTVTPPQTGSSTGMLFAVEAAVIGRNLGQPVDVYYIVTPRLGGAPRTSPVLRLSVLDLSSGDPRVPVPVIVEANGALTLVLSSFNGDATVEARPWPLMSSGQRYWLRAISGANSLLLAEGQLVNAPGNLRHPLSRNWLMALADQASVTLELKVAFDGGAEATAKTFRSPTYTVLNSTWDLEYNFDNDRIRDIGLKEQLNFPENGTSVMSVKFDWEEVTDTKERMGVESYAFTPTPEFKGKVLYVGNPTGTSHNNVFFVDLAEPWDVVRFMITSVNRDVTVSFKDRNLTIISGVITVPGGDVTRQHEVRYDDNGRRRIRHMEIRANDVVRFDTFKFRR